MTVFKGFLTLAKRNIGMFGLYFGIFVALSVAMVRFDGGESAVSFEEECLEIAVIDRDGGTLAKGLTNYLGDKHILVDVEDDKAAIQEALFYRHIYYVVTIPENFEKQCVEQEQPLQTTKLPGATTTFYIDQQIDTFLNDVRILVAAGFSVEDAVKEVNEIGNSEPQVTFLDKNGNGGQQVAYATIFRFLPYVIIAALAYVLGFIMISYRKKEIRQRIQCSTVSLRWQNLQLLAAYLVIGVSFWLICMLIPLALYGRELLTDTNLLYYMLNGLLMVLIALACAFTIGVAVEKPDVVNGVVNVVALGMSFLCGVFVPMSFLGEGVRKISHFLPVYWYENVVEILSNNARPTAEQIHMIWQSFGIQLLFAAVIFAVGLVISKYKLQES